MKAKHTTNWYDKKGNALVDAPTGSAEWLEQMEKVEELLSDNDYKVVKKTTGLRRRHGTPIKVSTVWLGLDHSFSGVEPLIFETMIFEEELSETEDGKFKYHESLDYQERYTKEEEAIKGHERAVKQFIKKGTESEANDSRDD